MRPPAPDGKIRIIESSREYAARYFPVESKLSAIGKASRLENVLALEAERRSYMLIEASLVVVA